VPVLRPQARYATRDELTFVIGLLFTTARASWFLKLTTSSVKKGSMLKETPVSTRPLLILVRTFHLWFSAPSDEQSTQRDQWLR
jgi:hypothetical protein